MTVKLVPAGDRHVEFVRFLSDEVFSRFGDYASLLPSTMLQPTVWTIVAERDGEPVGFAMYDLEQAARGIVDLTAIAVTPACQLQGVGRSLLEHVEQQARALASGPSPCVILTVAEDNLSARRLFERAGYTRLRIPTGRYAGGQRSRTLRKLLVDPERV